MILQISIPTYMRGIMIDPDEITMSTTCNQIERTTGGYRIKTGATANGPMAYSVTGTYTDFFNNDVTRTVSFTTDVYTWKERYYEVEFDTHVRTHIDASFGSQVEPDKVSVKCYLVCTGAARTLVYESYTPASYDQNGDLVDSYFTFTWHNRTITMQMQDRREYEFNYDRNGNYLPEGYCVENGVYIYYEPF